MGVYCYRVRAKGRKLADGNVVHEASFAYKYSGDWRANERWHRRYAAPAERAWASKPEAECRNVLFATVIAEGSPVYRAARMHGSMSDAGFGEERGYPVVGHIVRAGRGWRMKSVEEARLERDMVDSAVARHTAFRNLADMLDAGGRYRPSIDMREPWAPMVADAYDAAQAARNDDRRAYRYGAN